MKKRKFLGIVYLLLSYIIFLYSVEKITFLHYSFDLLMLFSIIDIFISLHFFLNIKKMYNFIYKYRYILGILVLSFLVINEYNGSSVELWNGTIQPDYQLNDNVIIGIARPIRSDEWLVGTPLGLTQAVDSVNFSQYNDILSANENLVTMYPKLANKNFFSLLSNPGNFAYLLLDLEKAFSFNWYFSYFVLFFASFELLMILTKKNKLYSLLGTCMITLSPVIQWWQSASITAYGALAVVLFYNLIISDNWKNKLLFAVLFGYSGFLYIMCMYPAWQIPYGYCYLIIMVYLIIENKKNVHMKDILYIIPSILIVIGLMLPLFLNNLDVINIISNTSYPGGRLSIGGGQWNLLFTYVADMFYPYKDIGNPCEYSQYLSLFPIPIFYGIYIMIKNKKMDIFLFLGIILLIVMSLWVFFPFGEFLSKLLLLYMSTESRIQVAIGYLSVILIIYILSNYQFKDKINYKKMLLLFCISLIVTYITIKISNDSLNMIISGYPNLYTSLISLGIFTVVITLFLLNNCRTNYILFGILIFVSIISGAIVSPINKGLSVFYDKPLSKEISKLVSEESNSVFIATDSGITLANYIAVNGGKTINTTNSIPDLELYKILDPSGKYYDIYNRYEHVSVDLVEEETRFVLNQADYITIKLNYNDICKIDVDYIVESNPSIEYNNFDLIYNEYGVEIYKTNCEG